MINVCKVILHKNRELSTVKFTSCYRGVYYYYYPSISVPPKFWNKDKQYCKVCREFPDASRVNSVLLNHERLMQDAFRFFEKDLIVPSNLMVREWIKNKILELNGEIPELKPKKVNLIRFIDYAVNYSKECDRAIGTKKSYGSTISCLKMFEEESGKSIYFTDVNISFYKSLKSYLIKKKYSKNYIGTIIKNIMHFMEESKEEGLHTSDSYRPRGVKSESEVADTIYLSEEEILKIYNLNINESLVIDMLGLCNGVQRSGRKQSFGNIRRKVESMKLERDRFLIGYCTALRISDYSRIDTLNIQNGLIAIWTKKKDKKVYIPIHWMLKEIIKRNNGLKLPPISDQKHNERIKDIGKAAGINETTLITITKGGVREDIVKSKFEFITSHTARRSGATNMYKAGIAVHYIQQILGHSKIDTTIKYLKVTSEETARSLQSHSFFTGQ